MKKLLLMIAFLAGTSIVVFAQKTTKFSPATRMVAANRDGRFALDEVKRQVQERKQRRLNAMASGQDRAQNSMTRDNDMDLPFATPFVKDGVKMVQCWISVSGDDCSALEALGVKILARFNGKVTANVPVDQLEKVAALGHVKKVSVARKLKKNTYRSRIMTNVDDVLTLSADAQEAGLLQAYDGTGVIVGIIDSGIDFGHPMFTGRTMKKIIYNDTEEELQEYTGNTAYYTDETHGTHTSTIAAGSNYTSTAYVYTNSTSYTTVQNATFGGMAPGADLVLCDLGEELSDANIAECIQYISNYADEVGKPCVISLSLGSHNGPHDGTGELAEVCTQYSGPGKVIFFASGNEGMDNLYLGKEASAASPLMTILKSTTRSEYGFDYSATVSYARTPGVELAARYYVVDTYNGEIVWTSDEITTNYRLVDEDGNVELYGTEISVNDTGSDGVTKLSDYFKAAYNNATKYGYLCCYMEQLPTNNKWKVESEVYYMKPVSNSYQIGVSIYPKNGRCYVDTWGTDYVTLSASSVTVDGHAFEGGNNDSSSGDEASYPAVISVGSYVSSVYWRGGTTSPSTEYWLGDGVYQQISTFSSYQKEGCGPTGLRQPWIVAPGEVILAGFNRKYTNEDYYYAYGSNKMLGASSGTSMSTPCAAGIAALWLQVKPTMTPEEVKEVMAATAIKDNFVNGTYSYMFGNGKIDALAGVKYLLDSDDSPLIVATPQVVSMTARPGDSDTKTVNVKGRNLTGSVSVTLNDETGMFAIDKTSIEDPTEGEDINVTYTPTAEGEHNATITLACEGADDVTIKLSASCFEGGSASDAYLNIARYASIDEAGWRTALVNSLYKYTVKEDDGVAWLTLPVYGAFVGARYADDSSTVGSGHPQTWIECSLGTNNTYGGRTWSANDVLLGSGAYFTGNTGAGAPRAIGFDSKNNTAIRAVAFYVTNVKEVRLYGKGRSGSSSKYPAKLSIYECTANADGTLTVGDTDVAGQSDSSQGLFTLTATDLDPTKIYKVETSIYRGYLYEVGFMTPLVVEPDEPAVPTAIRSHGNSFSDGAWYTIQGVRLNGWPTKPGLYIYNGKVKVVR